ncbi:MAG: hypothetical protein K5866_01300 [Treponema sp.]|nr:hypothetical protein [Treponema sp.]
MMTDNSESTDPNYFLTYSFSAQEVALLAKFLRNQEENLPDGLKNFSQALEKSIYNNLTIEEAKRFYS